jgi:hypothetical protein
MPSIPSFVLPSQFNLCVIICSMTVPVSPAQE